MEYATLGKTGLKVSRLGFGCMRLPMKSRDEVDREKAIPMLRRAVDLGVNYFDSAVMYCGGDSQRAVGEALEDIRDQVVISTKNHHYDKDDKDQWWQHLEDSLERLRTGHIDIYNFHGMNYERFEASVAGDDGLYQEMLKAKEQGMIHHVCHSFHGSAESLKKCVDTGLFESVTCQYNLLDRHLEEAIAYAAENGMGVVIMGPVGGGRLGYPSERAAELVGDVESTPELALRFVLSNPNVTVALSGMQNVQMLEENVETVSKAGKLTQEDHERIEAAVQERKELAGLYCTGCNYCMPCPAGVDIPQNFEILNLERVFGLTEHARQKYASLAGKAALCRLCGQCVEECPQDLDIPARLSEAVAALDERAGSITGWAELRGGERTGEGMLNVKIRYHLKNFTDRRFEEVSVRLSSHREEQVAPQEFTISGLKPYARRHKDLEVLARRPLETLSVDARLSYAKITTLESLYFVLTAAQKGAQPGGARRSKGTLHVPSPIHPIHASKQSPTGHGFDWSASFDEEKLYVRAEVDDDLQKLADGDVGGRTECDSLRIFLDGRKSEEIGRAGYEDGVMHVTVFPPADAEADALMHVRGNGEGVEASVCRTETGYGVECSIPWAAFSQCDGRPAVIGFDIVQRSFGEGGDALRLSWTGREDQERAPGTFGKLLMVD